MARGWESKAVEEQISSARDENERSAKTSLTDEEIRREAKRQGLLSSRARVARDLKAARHERHFALLRRTLAHLDAELASLDADNPSS